MNDNAFTLTLGDIAVIVTVVLALGGVIIRTGRQHIDNRVERARSSLREELQKEWINVIGDIQKSIQQHSTDVALLQRTIENGLSHRQERIENKVDRLLEAHHWDGNERRRDP